MSVLMRNEVRRELAEIRSVGQYKDEQPISTPQGGTVGMSGYTAINMCANNYLGLANDSRIVRAAKRALDEWGFGVAGGRPVCGTQEIHQELERGVCAFLGADDAILYGSCYDANTGLFAPLLGPDDAIISDSLNHASIIDGIRLSKAQRLLYRSRDMTDLEAQLRGTADARYRLIATDGVFSMEGSLAPLAQICDLAQAYDALVMVDDSHAIGVVGATGRGSPELFDVQDRVDLVTGTFGKALGGASGGFVAGRAELIALLRQRSRPYLFSNSLSPVLVGAALAALDLLRTHPDRLRKLHENTRYFRCRLAELGLDVLGTDHPIVPVILGDAALAGRVAQALLDRGVLATAFSYPVVPVGEARIRMQVSAIHTPADLEHAAVATSEALHVAIHGGEQ